MNGRRLVELADELRASLDTPPHDAVVGTLYEEAGAIAGRAVRREGKLRRSLDERLDDLLTSRIFGFPVMLALLAVVFWVTIAGANVPSQALAAGLFWVEDRLAALFNALSAPWWLTGFLVHGVYRALAWVVSVMLPPMAIFFPMFTILEDLGYLPRVAFNMDRLFRAVGAHGKQALTMAMGFGCNAAGVTSCRIIESPRERLIAIITNNFVPCNGRFPTLIMLATIFVAASVSPAVASIAAAGAVVGVVVLGVLVTLAVSGLLSKTVLKGEPSAFALELPPYRRPRIGQILYTSLIDRTYRVLTRAVLAAIPAGGVCWLLGNFYVGGQSLMAHAAGWLNPLGLAIGLDGVVLLAYVVAIPANEIVVPTILMAYTASSRMIDLDGGRLSSVLIDGHGWTLLTAICLMLFCLLHNPCSTTIWTIYKETGSKRWTLVATLLPLATAFAVCLAVAQGARLLGYG